MKFLPECRQPKPIALYQHFRVGTFDFADGSVDIADPCYDRDDGASIWDCKVKPGTYNVFVNVKDFASYFKDEDDLCPNEIKTMHDARVTSVYIQHSSYGTRRINGWNTIGRVAVDAGLCGFYNHKPDFDDEEDRKWDGFWKNLKTLVANQTCDLGKYGVTVSSGYGDGYYPVYARKEGDDIVGLKIRFI